MNQTHVLVLENKNKWTESSIKQAIEYRYKTILLDMTVTNELITILLDDKTYKQFLKINGKNYEKTLQKIIEEDFSDEFEQTFQDGVWIV